MTQCRMNTANAAYQRAPVREGRAGRRAPGAKRGVAGCIASSYRWPADMEKSFPVGKPSFDENDEVMVTDLERVEKPEGRSVWSTPRTKAETALLFAYYF